jgi:hypothetical protein
MFGGMMVSHAATLKGAITANTMKAAWNKVKFFVLMPKIAATIETIMAEILCLVYSLHIPPN